MLKKIICVITAVMLCLSLYIPAMAAPDFEVSYISNSGGKISCTLGEIEITFTDDVDAKTLSGITFTNAYGDEIKGGAYAVKGDSDDEVKLKFGRLAEGNYILCITEDLKSVNGESASYAEYEYTVLTDEDVAVAESKISDMEVGETTKDNMTADSTNMSFSGPDGYHTYSVEKTDGGENYVYYTCAGSQGVGGSFLLTLPTAMETGKFVLDTAVKSDGGNMARNLFSPRNSSNKKVYAFSIKNDNVLHCATQGKFNDSAFFTGAENQKDADGFWNLRLIISRNSTDEPWAFKVYETTTSYANPIYEISIPNSDLDDLKSIIVFDCWNTTNNDAGFMCKDIKAFTPRTPAVIYTDGEDGNPASEEIRFVSSEDLFTELITEDTVTLTDIDGEEIKADISYEEDNRTIVVKPHRFLKYDHKYNLSVSDGICNGIDFTTGNTELIVDGVSYDSAEKELSVDITKLTEASQDIVILAGVYNDEDVLQFFIQDDINSDEDLPAEIDLSSYTLPDSGTFKVYVWQQCDGFLRAVSYINSCEF